MIISAYSRRLWMPWLHMMIKLLFTISYLSLLTDGSGFNLLVAHIHDKDEDVRKMIADILGRLALPDAVPILIEMLKDPNDNVRSSAIEGLGRITDHSIVDNLLTLLDQDDWVAMFA